MAVWVVLVWRLLPEKAPGCGAGDTEVVPFIKDTLARSWPPLSGPCFCIVFVRSQFWKVAGAGVLGQCQAIAICLPKFPPWFQRYSACTGRFDPAAPLPWRMKGLCSCFQGRSRSGGFPNHLL